MDEVSAITLTILLLSLLLTVLAIRRPGLSKPNDPPCLGETIPFVSNAWQFLTNKPLFIDRIRKALKSSPIVGCWLGPLKIHFVTGGNNISFVDAFWDFEKQGETLAFGMSSWINRRAVMARDRFCAMCLKWYEIADQEYDWENATNQKDIEWEPIFGSEISKAHIRWIKLFKFSRQTIGAIFALFLLGFLGADRVAFPTSGIYNESVQSYFSQQQEALSPACVILPQSAEDVSVTIQTLTQHPQCDFAIRSGGHTNWAGASNIADGVAIDLQGLDSIEIHHDTSTISVGVGATWDDVYAKLDPLGLSVNGGRSAGVGVGGLTLGGGVSYFSPRYGWTCDAVSSMDIVLANASVIKVDANTSPDLFQALKGGNNNFGVVTRIEFTTFEQGLIWTGTLYHPLSAVDDIISEFVKITERYDEYASFITTFGYSQAQGVGVVTNLLDYTKEVESPLVYQGLLSLPNLVNTSQLVNMTTLAKATQILQPEHPRSLTRVSTLVVSSAVLKAAFAQWNASLPSISNISNIIWGVSLEPLPPAIYARHGKDNALGLANRSGSLIIALVTVSWTDAADDAVVTCAAIKLMDAINNEARQIGDLDPFVYLNYAAKDQDPIAGYGPASVRQLKTVQKRVDPRKVFTNQVPGGYKIWRENE
ncbi:hypothetical protein GGR54DRAFT_651721 [Hypoxylon sp. NC1633]|nr:hypothetical protein GGR54DRAFT_651721 [Hypoxylon sp. NC1633]